MKEDIIELNPINNTFIPNSSGGATYGSLSDKPSINGVTLFGNKTTKELNINIPTKNSELINDEKFITEDVNNLFNYYDKEEIDNFINNKASLNIDYGADTIEIVQGSNSFELSPTIGWTSITPNTYQELDIRNAIANGKKRFTILIYMRKGENRQATKYELTITELEKLFTKVNANELVITRMIMGISNTNQVAMLKQFVKQKYDENNQVIQGVLQIKYQCYENDVVIASFDNFEYTLYAE